MAHYLKYRRCAAIGCDSKFALRPDFGMFTFPTGNCRARYQQWKELSRNPCLSVERMTRSHLCGLHFEDNQFYDIDRQRLIRKAVPTIAVGTHRYNEMILRYGPEVCFLHSQRIAALNIENADNGSKLAHLEKVENIEEIEEVIITGDEDDSYCQPELLCSIPTCRSSSKILFTFPTDDVLCARWSEHCRISECGLVDMKEIRKKYIICNAHFEKDQFSDELETKLIPHAIPTVFEDALHNEVDCLSVSSTTSWQETADAIMEVDLEPAESKNYSNEMQHTGKTSSAPVLNHFGLQVLSKPLCPNKEKILVKVKDEQVVTMNNDEKLQPNRDIQANPKYVYGSNIGSLNELVSGSNVNHTVGLPICNQKMFINRGSQTQPSFSPEEVKFPKLIEETLQKVEAGRNDLRNLSRLLKYCQSMKVSGTCCLCLKSRSDIEEMDNDLLKKYQILFNEMVDVPDYFPKKICSRCIMNLNVCYTFYKGFSTAQEQLMRIVSVLQNNSVDINKTTFENNTNENSETNYTEKLLSDVVLSCKECGEMFLSRYKLDSHMSSKHGLQWFLICEKCGKMLKTKAALFSHQASSCKDYYKCTVCQKSFRTKYMYVCHRKTFHKPSNLTICEICGKYLSVASYATHKANHNKCVLCDLCGMTFGTLNLLRVHYRRWHLRKAPASCKICYKGCFTASKVAYHFTVEHGKLNYICILCTKQLKTKTILLEHYRTKHLSGGTCVLCDEFSGTVDDALLHLQNKHSEQEIALSVLNKNFAKCYVCNTEYHSREEIVEHIKLEHIQYIKTAPDENSHVVKKKKKKQSQEWLEEEKPNFECMYFCVCCKIQRQTQESFINHAIDRHSKFRYACHLCKKVCFNETRFIKHLSRHDNQARKKCLICLKYFQESAIDHRTSVHSDECDITLRLTSKMFAQCRMCGLECSDMLVLSKHFLESSHCYVLWNVPVVSKEIE